ncbi:hypothetical protein GDO81_004299 [Engystomops pustulosus]|uniref:Uncharacterized protein n=1 Tax=Engystomops pustulosus TaxID=76066 RepID=A0AAV6ZYW7_ENGPU|nr:hypothetical protein GDO81_004299 [Engystomops pustulosus]
MMLGVFKKVHTLPEGAETAVRFVEKREGKKYVNSVRLYKYVDMPSKGRLQPSVWKQILTTSRGELEDKGILEAAQAHYRVASALQVEGWSEVQGDGGSTKAEVLYGYVKLLDRDVKCGTKMATVPCAQPQPYNGGQPGLEGWTCRVCGL